MVAEIMDNGKGLRIIEYVLLLVVVFSGVAGVFLKTSVALLVFAFSVVFLLPFLVLGVDDEKRVVR